MTLATFQELSNLKSRSYHDEPAQLSMEPITAIGSKG